MIDRFYGLRHYAVVGSNDQHDDIGYACTPRPHRCECCVPRSVEKGNPTTIFHLDYVRSDVLGDAAGLSFCDVGISKTIEKRGFPVIDMSHNGYHWWTRVRFTNLFLFRDLFKLFNFFHLHGHHFETELVGNGDDGVHV